jgi:methylamine dehydrogenase heavy chain
VTEKAVRVGGTWYFTSFAGRIFPLRAEAQQAELLAPWWLTTDAERKAGWRPGGMQQLAVNTQGTRLFAIMHRGGVETHKDPGKDIWVYDLQKQRRVQQFALKNLASSIQLSSDDKPLLFSLFIDSTDLDVYDAASGALLRTVDHIGTSPTIMVTP